MSRLADVLVTLGLAIGGYWALLFLAQRAVLYQPPHASGAPARPPDAQQVWLPTGNGRVEAWYLPPTIATASPAPLLLFAHGNAELIDFWPGEFDEPRGWGMAVLLLEYPGYGRSEGRPSQGAISTAVRAAYDWARARPDIDAGRIVAYGRSLGGGALCTLVGSRDLTAIVLESSFTSVAAFARRFGLPSFLVRDTFDNLAALRAYRGPVLVLHGAHDEVIPADHGRALAATAVGAELYLPACGHNDCQRSWSRVHAFLTRNGVLPVAFPPAAVRS